MMQISLLQFQPGPGDKRGNLARIEGAARAAATAGSTLLVTPELSVTGYAGLSEMGEYAEPCDGPTVIALAALADELGISVVAGYPEREGSNVFNAAVLTQPGGGRVHYRKCHLFGPGEKAAFTPASEQAALFDVGGMKGALLICYDVEFPEMVRSVVLAGAELVIVPTALPRSASSRVVSETMIPTRAMENHVFIAYAGLCGEERGLAYQGGSTIAAPDGEALARAGGREAMLTAALDPASYRALDLDPYLEDRRPELYATLCRRWAADEWATTT